jgi:hypothetical protein
MINDFLPKSLDLFAQSRRAPLDFLGDICSALVGSATMKQVEVVMNRVRALENVMKRETGSVAKALSDLSSYTQKVDNLVEMVKVSAIDAETRLPKWPLDTPNVPTSCCTEKMS